MADVKPIEFTQGAQGNGVDAPQVVKPIEFTQGAQGLDINQPVPYHIHNGVDAPQVNFRDLAGSPTAEGSHTGGDGSVWWGANTFASALASIDKNGVLRATGAIISGNISATTGAIGGFDIGADYVRDTANSFGMASTVTGGDDVRFWAGATFANRATAVFRVTEAGVVTGSNITITGGAISGITLDIGGSDATSLHFDADGNLWLGAATFNIATNPFAVSNAGVLRAVSGTIANWTLSTSALSTGAFDTNGTMYFGTSGLSLSDTFKVTAAGALTATSATISGTITATAGTIGGWTIASDKLSAGTDADYIGLIPGTGIQMGDSTFADAEFSVTNAGVLKAVSGTIGGCALATTSIGSTTFVSGPLGSGWNISNTGTAEFQNCTVRGIIRTSVFEKDTISCVNGIVLVSSADVLSADMTAADNSTVTISGQTTFSANEVIRLKDGTDDEWMLVTNAGSAPTYTVTRDLASSYGANANPVWKKGTAVVSMGVGTGTKTGFVLMDSSSANSPYIDVYGRNSNTYTDYTLHGRFGWLKGITDADLGLNNTDKWGLYTDNGYFKGSIYGSTITGGTIQTATTGQRLVMNSTGLGGIDASDNIIFALNSTSGVGAGDVIYINVPIGSAITYAYTTVVNNDAYGLSIIKNTTNENQDLATGYIASAFTANSAVAYTASGPTLDIVRNAPTLSGGATLTDSGCVLTLANNNASGTGNVIDITNAGTGYDIDGTSSTWYVKKTGAITALTYNGLTIDSTTGTLDITNAKTLTVTGDATISATPYTPSGTDVAVADGGTGKSSWTQYLIPYADTTTSFSQIAIGTDGQVLTSGGAGVAPAFETISTGIPFAADSGSTDAYAVTLSPAPASYTEGMTVLFTANTANTGACTLNCNSLGAITIKKKHDDDLANNDILENQLVLVAYGHHTLTLVDSHTTAPGSEFYVYSNARPYVSQSFTTPATTGTILRQVKFYLAYVTGNRNYVGGLKARLYAHSGTYGTSSLPSEATYGNPLATSDAVNVDMTTFPDSNYHQITFTFSGANRYALSPSTYYCIGLWNVTSTQIKILRKSTSGHGGNDASFEYTDGDYDNWLVGSGDLDFEVYAELPCFEMLSQIAN